jgi:hypothetical protein
MNIKPKTINLHDLDMQSAGFLKTNFALIKLSLLVSLGIVIVLTSLIFYSVINRPNPADYAFDGTNIARLVRLDLPDISNEAIMRWSSQVVSDIFTFNFLLLDEHFAKIKEYFTEDGYAQFIESAQSLIDDARTKELKYQANSCDVVSIQNTTTIKNVNSTSTLWLIQIPLLIDIESRSEKRLVRYVITATVESGDNVRQDKTIAFLGLRFSLGTDAFCNIRAAV